MVLGIYFVDWCGRKGLQIVVLKLVLCLFAMFFIMLMPLILSERNLYVVPYLKLMLEIMLLFEFKSYLESSL